MAEEIREKCLKIIADSCELDVKELYQKYAKAGRLCDGCTLVPEKRPEIVSEWIP